VALVVCPVDGRIVSYLVAPDDPSQERTGFETAGRELLVACGKGGP
jgi:hypothetical protein